MGARVIEVIEADEPRGEGTEENPARRVKVYYDKDGNFLAENDSWFQQREYLRRAEKTEKVLI